MGVIEDLHRSLDARLTPEAVCKLILDVPGVALMPAQRRVLQRAAGSRAAVYSSMADDFERPEPAVHKVRVLLELLAQDGVLGTLVKGDVTPEMVAQLAGDPWRLLGQLRILAPFVGWYPGRDFQSRMNRQQRAGDQLGLSKRKYNRLVRHLVRTEGRAVRLQQQILLRQLVMVGRSGLAYSITLDEMRADPIGACFVAYWVAQRNRRRQFTLDGRDNPFDTIAQALLDRCVAAPAGTVDWWMIARAYPQPVVVARLDDARRGQLMGDWFGFMRLAAEMLRGQYDSWPVRDVEPVVPDDMWSARPGLMPSRESRGGRTEKVVDRKTMIVRAGVDSSTWNTLAQAYNAARSGWLNCVGAAGALEVLDAACPGKVMRLMAADLAYYHRQQGGGLDPQTQVWAALPLPWEALAGDEECTADTVEWACRGEGVDPHATGWTAPRQVGAVAEWKPTPELVHGVEVADPLWAGLLRRAGVFSGKGVNEDVLSGGGHPVQ